MRSIYKWWQRKPCLTSYIHSCQSYQHNNRTQIPEKHSRSLQLMLVNVLYKGGNIHPIVQPRSKPAPARPNPTAKATAHFVITHLLLLFFLFLALLWLFLSSLPLHGSQGKDAGKRFGNDWFLFLSCRHRFSSCNMWSHCL